MQVINLIQALILWLIYTNFNGESIYKNRQFLTNLHPHVKSWSFPSFWLDDEGGISGSAVECRMYIFSTLLSKNFPPWSQRQHMWLETSSITTVEHHVL